jgi:drug/metabolite transporter (DMT)-like permease
MSAMTVGILLALLVSLLATAQNTMLTLLGKWKKIKTTGDEKRPDIKTLKEADNKMSLITAWASAIVALSVTLVVLICFGGFSRIPELPNKFWWATAAKVPLYALAIWSYAMAHRKGDISLISPLLAITPAIIVVIAPAMIGQNAGPLGISGILLIVIGAYFLNFSQRKNGLLGPMKELWKDHGARFMMLTATVYALTSILDAIGVKSAGNDFLSALLWVIAFNLGAVLFITPLAIYSFKKLRKEYWELPQVREFLGTKGFIKMSLTGFFNGSGEIAQMMAMTFLLAAYVNAIKRFSMVLGVFVGAIVFKDKNFKERLTGSLIMLCGVVLIIISAVK